MALKLISEAKSFDLSALNVFTETVNNGDGTSDKNYYIEGPYIQTEVKNRNGRNYPLPLMHSCVEKYIAERMNPQVGFRSFGELGHPDGVEINLDKVSHYVQSLVWQGKNCIGKAEILKENPAGRIVETFLKKKLRLGVSTRGLGALAEKPNQDGSKNVDSYEMIAVDIVADPSAPQGFVDGILENKEYIIKQDGVIIECYNNLEKEVSNLPKNSILKEQLYLLSLEKFLKDFTNN